MLRGSLHYRGIGNERNDLRNLYEIDGFRSNADEASKSPRIAWRPDEL